MEAALHCLATAARQAPPLAARPAPGFTAAAPRPPRLPAAAHRLALDAGLGGVDLEGQAGGASGTPYRRFPVRETPCCCIAGWKANTRSYAPGRRCPGTRCGDGSTGPRISDEPGRCSCSRLDVVVLRQLYSPPPPSRRAQHLLTCRSSEADSTSATAATLAAGTEAGSLLSCCTASAAAGGAPMSVFVGRKRTQRRA